MTTSAFSLAVPAASAPRPWLHALVLAAAALVLCWPVTLASSAVAGSIGAILGTFIAERLIQARWRLWVLFLGSVAGGVVGAFLVGQLLKSAALGELLSPTRLLWLGEALTYGGLCFFGSVAVRTLAIRFRAALALEGGLAVLAVAATVSAHRDGMIARPLEVSDWFWGQGIDPVFAFLGVGLVGAILFAGILAYGRSAKRALLQLLVVLILGLFLALRIHSKDPSLDPKGAGAAQGQEGKDPRQGQGGGGSGQNQNQKPNDDLPSNGQNSQERPAAVVVFHKDVVPAAGAFYFRHGAFSQFNGTRLVEATIPGLDPDARHTFPVELETIPGPQHEALDRSEVATDVALLTEHSRMFALADATVVEPMANPEPARFRRAYRVVSKVLVGEYQQWMGLEPGDPTWDDETWAHYTQLPKDERYYQLASDIKASVKEEYQDDPLVLSLAVKSYLEKTSTYSFKRSYAGTDDPTGDFLFSEDRRGYCVHLSHSAAYLLRALGVPTRVSAGYAIPASNLAGGSALLIKQGDAHAWAEIYLAGAGWIPIEVTPEKTDVEPKRFEEKDLQQLLGEMARKEGRNQRQAASGPKLIDLLRKLWSYVPWALLLALGAAYAIKLWRLYGPVLFPGNKAPRLAYRAALDRLAMFGLVREHGEPRERFAQRVKDRVPSFLPLTQAHVGSAFGSRSPLGPLDGARIERLPLLVGRELATVVPWWRRILGALNPLSWWWSR